ncbi:MAG: phosphoribosylaminoimidazolesuccinocarboxamide synthase [bacterium]
MKKLDKIYEGKAKIYYKTSRDGILIQEFKDHATAFDGNKFAVIDGKGLLNAKISSLLFRELARRGIKNHFIDDYDERSHIVIELKIIPLEIVVRNYSAGSLVKRLGFKEGVYINPPIVEFYYKKDELHDPLVNNYHIRAMGLADDEIIEEIEDNANRINRELIDIFSRANIRLVDFKLEFGRSLSGDILLGDEITPDTCRLWDEKSLKTLDKDRFRFDIGDLIEGYNEIFKRISNVI